jgi:hypothetical protein
VQHKRKGCFGHPTAETDSARVETNPIGVPICACMLCQKIQKKRMQDALAAQSHHFCVVFIAHYQSIQAKMGTIHELQIILIPNTIFWYFFTTTIANSNTTILIAMRNSRLLAWESNATFKPEAQSHGCVCPNVSPLNTHTNHMRCVACRDMGTFLRQWVLEVFHQDKWIEIAREDSDALDGCRCVHMCICMPSCFDTSAHFVCINKDQDLSVAIKAQDHTELGFMIPISHLYYVTEFCQVYIQACFVCILRFVALQRLLHGYSACMLLLHVVSSPASVQRTCSFCQDMYSAKCVSLLCTPCDILLCCATHIFPSHA